MNGNEKNIRDNMTSNEITQPTMSSVKGTRDTCGELTDDQSNNIATSSDRFPRPMTSPSTNASSG
jgi:hypothetical protein